MGAGASSYQKTLSTDVNGGSDYIAIILYLELKEEMDITWNCIGAVIKMFVIVQMVSKWISLPFVIPDQCARPKVVLNSALLLYRQSWGASV